MHFHRRKIVRAPAAACALGLVASGASAHSALAGKTVKLVVPYLRSTDLQQCLLASHRIQAGVVLVSTPMHLDLRFPFGGYKDSGLGREGIDGFRHFYTEEKTVTIALQRPAMERLGAIQS